MPKKDDHYSYSMYADPAFAEEFDSSHFGGSVGELFLELQQQVLFEFLGDVRDARMLDVGAGTGRAALAFAKRGAHVTGVDASPEMLKMARFHAAQENLSVEFQTGDAHALDFSSRSFDAAVSLRMLMHTVNWRQCVRELCRVSRQRVLFDYPEFWSAAILQTMARRIAKFLGRRVETYRALSTREVDDALAQNGFKIVKLHRQFVLPMGFHRMIGSRKFTLNIEKFLARLGFLNLIGSPVTVLAERVGWLNV